MSNATSPEGVERYRVEYRAAEIPANYDGRGHLLFTFGGGTLALVACLLMLRDVKPLEWLAVPLALVYANLAEYLGHRFPMHRPYRGLGLVYKRHAGQHHRFFNHDAMPLGERRDLRAVLFPPVLVVFFFGAFATPVWFALAWAVSRNVAWLFLASGVFYYVHYEVLHLAYHLKPGHWLAELGLVKRLQWLHRNHHDPALMARQNFNITWPLCDWLFGTLRR
ncbi:MAG: hypothetical protein ACREO3_09275 [Arenimonas sp.]